jgi:predicted transcriptional regulator
MHEHGCPLIFAWQYCQAFPASILFLLFSTEIEIMATHISPIDEAARFAYLVIYANEGASMKAEDKKFFEAKAAVLKALAHPTRLWMVEHLETGEKCVCEFAEFIDADFSTVSKHLTVLKQAGIVQDEKGASRSITASRSRASSISCIAWRPCFRHAPWNNFQ